MSGANGFIRPESSFRGALAIAGVAVLVATLALYQLDPPNPNVQHFFRIEALASELGLNENVTLVGEIAEDVRVYGLMKASKVLALPSMREGFGLVAIEANAANIPVVTLDHEDNAARDLIAPGVNGCLCSADPRDLAGAIDRTLSERARMNPMHDIARYDWTLCAGRLSALLRGVG